jgi:hypothetical protein
VTTTPIPLSISDDRKSDLVGYLTKVFSDCVTARRTQIDSKYSRWMDNYSGKPLEAIRTTPFYRASNFIPQLIRMHTDILSARVFGIILGTRPTWEPRSLIEMPHEDREAVSDWLEFTSKFILRLPEILDTAIFRAFKAGHVMLKGPWIEDRRSKVSPRTANPSGNERSLPHTSTSARSRSTMFGSTLSQSNGSVTPGRSFTGLG